ncbi:MAG: DUF1571 domain-containing protein [Planctomycetes bacterium]|nr:DUF1571 domain-containing protein [Planctomycetota bacterium]
MQRHEQRRSSNLWIRLAVGLGLVALFCVQCAESGGPTGGGRLVAATVTPPPAPQASSEAVEALETLAQTDPMGLLERCLANYDRTVEDYTCRFTKRERIEGRLGEAEEIDVRFMDDPFSVAMRWRKNAPVADRCLYVAGAHDGDMLLRPRGLLSIVGTVRRKPDCDQVMESTLRPITLFGFRNSLQQLIEVSRQADQEGDLKWSYVGRQGVADQPALVIERHLPEDKGYPAYRTRVYIDTENLLPVCVEAWDAKDRLLCRYVFSDVKLNTGLTAKDFTPDANGM